MSGRAHRVPLSARFSWCEAPVAPRRRAPRKLQDPLVLQPQVSETESGSEGEEEEEGVQDARIGAQVLRRVGLRGLVAGPMGQGLVASRMPGFGRGVPPSTRIELCVALAFSETEARVEGGRFFVLTTAHDGYNLTWLPSRADGWEQVALLPFGSVFTRHEGLAARGPAKPRAVAAVEASDPTRGTDLLVEELRQQGWEGVEAFVFILVKYFPRLGIEGFQGD